MESNPMNEGNDKRGAASRILVVDDTPANLRLLSRLLGDEGYIVHAANGASSLFMFLNTMAPDLILLDIRMPGMDGYQICTQLKEDPRTRDIPVIFISAADEALDKVKAFACGGIDYVVKPFQEEEVLARVGTHLALHALQKRLEERVQERTAELSKAKEELVASHQLLQRIIDNAMALIYVKDLAGRYLLINSRFRELFRKSEPDIVGKTDAEAFAAPLADVLSAVDRQVLDSGSTVETEDEIPFDDGVRTYISVKSPLQDEAGNIYALCAISTDITERVRTEISIRELNDMLERRLSERLSEPGRR
jgi:PAS domain S-box-containing protein